MDGAELVAAVGSGDAEAVTRLLEAGADPDTLADDGLPVLCRAIAAYDEEVADALVEGGADPDRKLPDGTTPLVRAVDGGSPSVVTAVLGRDPLVRLSESGRRELLARARRWYERGAEAGLRDRTGASGPVHRARVMDDEYRHVTQLTQDGSTVRAGHGAILTNLEWAFRVLTPVDELAARALAPGDPDHVDWSSVTWVLCQRRSKETWSAMAAYRHSSAPLARRFALDALWTYAWCPWLSRRNSYEKEMADLLVSWATDGDEDPEVLAEVLRLLDEADRPESVALGLRYAGHRDPRVRAKVPDLLIVWEDPSPIPGAEARAALLALAADEDWHVRAAAGGALCAARDGGPEVTDAVVALLRDPAAEVRAWMSETVTRCEDRSTAVADALFALLDEEDPSVRLNAAYALLRRKDPRTAEAVERVGPLSHFGPGPDHRLSTIWDWERNHDQP
ncbi:HEAT repeat domain-containing protein [Streptomyces sp. NPDC126497]|uniref:HEAT repeat domain-containing protein n=1 Tax=Streptomyces sp. NPDC126497 TaxID=3155313 RepID=UPI0033308919